MLIMVVHSILKKKRIKSRANEITNEIAGFKQALLKTRQIM